MRIAILSDTHLPRGARALPEACRAEIAASDLAIHAGDFSTEDVLLELEAIGPPVIGVHGNVDSMELRERLPMERVEELEGTRVAIVHDPGPALDRLASLEQRFPDADAVIFGHTHLPQHEERDGFQIFNPGSPTEKRRAPNHSFGVAEVQAGRVTFQHVPL